MTKLIAAIASLGFAVLFAAPAAAQVDRSPGAMVGHCEGQIRTRQEHGQIDDADALELHEEPAGSLERI